MTDQIVPPEEPSTLPVITSNPAVGSVIKFNGIDAHELRIPLTIRDENTFEPLKVRFQLESTAVLTPLKDRAQTDFPCPEDIIPGTGAVLRTEYHLSIDSSKIPLGACTKLSVAISANFLPCMKTEPDRFDATSFEDDDAGHRTLAVYWIWEVSMDPAVNPDQAVRLLSTCPLPNTTDSTRSGQ